MKSNLWNEDDTESYLNANPLPADFVWLHLDGSRQIVRPVHCLRVGFGKWLRETSYFPGLFETAHRLLSATSQCWLHADKTRLDSSEAF